MLILRYFDFVERVYNCEVTSITSKSLAYCEEYRASNHTNSLEVEAFYSSDGRFIGRGESSKSR